MVQTTKQLFGFLVFTMVDVPGKTSVITLPGTLRWAAPELLTGNRGPSFLGASSKPGVPSLWQ